VPTITGQLHAPAALSTGKEPQVPVAQEGVWTPEPVLTLCRTEEYFAPAGNGTPDVQRTARRNTVQAIPYLLNRRLKNYTEHISEV
jgi:hypothetical protein